VRVWIFFRSDKCPRREKRVHENFLSGIHRNSRAPASDVRILCEIQPKAFKTIGFSGGGAVVNNYMVRFEPDHRAAGMENVGRAFVRRIVERRGITCRIDEFRTKALREELR